MKQDVNGVNLQELAVPDEQLQQALLQEQAIPQDEIPKGELEAPAQPSIPNKVWETSRKKAERETSARLTAERAEVDRISAQLEQKERELEQYKLNDMQRIFETDLAELQTQDNTIKSFEDLGREYLALRKAGVPNLIAFEAIKAARKQQPKSTGDIYGDVKHEENKYASMPQDEFEKIIRAAQRGELKKK